MTHTLPLRWLGHDVTCHTDRLPLLENSRLAVSIFVKLSVQSWKDRRRIYSSYALVLLLLSSPFFSLHFSLAWFPPPLCFSMSLSHVCLSVCLHLCVTVVWLVTVGRLWRGHNCSAFGRRPRGSTLLASLILECVSSPLIAPSLFIHTEWICDSEAW